MAMAMSESNPMPIMLERSASGALSADLVPGSYHVIVMMESRDPNAAPASGFVSLVVEKAAHLNNCHAQSLASSMRPPTMDLLQLLAPQKTLGRELMLTSAAFLIRQR